MYVNRENHSQLKSCRVVEYISILSLCPYTYKLQQDSVCGRDRFTLITITTRVLGCHSVYSYFMPVCSIVKTITPRCRGRPDALLHEAEGLLGANSKERNRSFWEQILSFILKRGAIEENHCLI